MTKIDKIRSRMADAVKTMPLQQTGMLLMDLAQAMLDKQNNYLPNGSLLMRLSKADGTLTVCLGKDSAAPRLAAAHDALQAEITSAQETDN